MKKKKQKGNNDILIKKISFYITLISFILSIIGCILIAFGNIIGVVVLMVGVFGFILVLEINGKGSRYGEIIMEYGKEFRK